jgi:hypothetical protein
MTHTPGQPHITNPGAIGDPDQTPHVWTGNRLRRALRPCTQPVGDGECGGVNGFHAEGCPKDPR